MLEDYMAQLGEHDFLFLLRCSTISLHSCHRAVHDTTTQEIGARLLNLAVQPACFSVTKPINKELSRNCRVGQPIQFMSDKAKQSERRCTMWHRRDCNVGWAWDEKMERIACGLQQKKGNQLPNRGLIHLVHSVGDRRALQSKNTGCTDMTLHRKLRETQQQPTRSPSRLCLAAG